MGGWKVGTIRGIGIYVHWTFWVLVLFFMLSAMSESGLIAGLITAGLILAVFACVLAHEFGHAIAAEWFGIPTTDITLLPFGGLARLAKMPQEPWQELIIAVAGPAVNVIIALGLIIVGAIGNQFAQVEVNDTGELGFLGQLCLLNIGLVIFNMLPAFPMDGGRVLRSLLSMYTGHLRATEIAARVGRWMALIFLIGSFFYGFGLFLVAIFVFLAGTAELFEARRRSAANPPWVRWAWTVGQPNQWPAENSATWTYDTNSFQAADRSTDEVTIDATDVRHLPPGSYRIG